MLLLLISKLHMSSVGCFGFFRGTFGWISGSQLRGPFMRGEGKEDFVWGVRGGFSFLPLLFLLLCLPQWVPVIYLALWDLLSPAWHFVCPFSSGVGGPDMLQAGKFPTDVSPPGPVLQACHRYAPQAGAHYVMAQDSHSQEAGLCLNESSRVEERGMMIVSRGLQIFLFSSPPFNVFLCCLTQWVSIMC